MHAETSSKSGAIQTSTDSVVMLKFMPELPPYVKWILARVEAPLDPLDGLLVQPKKGGSTRNAVGPKELIADSRKGISNSCPDD